MREIRNGLFLIQCFETPFLVESDQPSSSKVSKIEDSAGPSERISYFSTSHLCAPSCTQVCSKVRSQLCSSSLSYKLFFAYTKRVELPRSFSQKVDVDTTINCFSLFFWCQMRSARMSYVLGSAESLGAAKNGVRLSLKTRSSRNVSISIRGDVPSSHMREGISSKFVIVRSWTLLQCLSVCR